MNCWHKFTSNDIVDMYVADRAFGSITFPMIL